MRGDGEIVEEIVSKERQREINQVRTKDQHELMSSIDSHFYEIKIFEVPTGNPVLFMLKIL